ncbi:hypothetical protein [Embleya sp. NPDC005971]|uniref:hypothetical protein n=1 Tax=Embleya sp. NPDC005971 TaxID=3156724 RepID=UPI00340E9D68
MTTRVAWTTLVPEQTEKIVAIMLCRENPSRQHVRPSRGDGGIDVIEVTPAGWIVDQIKYFATNLTAGQKKQIVDSLAELRSFAAAKGAVIAQWRLVLPLNPTNENRAWFEDFTKGAGHPCHWHGLTHLEGLAAQFPDIVDYYLHEGRERLQGLYERVVNIMGLQCVAGAGAVVVPGDVATGLQDLYQALNAHDPHYTYAFAIDPERPAIAQDPRLVAATQQNTVDGSWITFKIYARYPQAVDDQPLTFNIAINVEPDSDTARALDATLTYGVPLRLDSTDTRAFHAVVDLPGGLGGEMNAGVLSLVPLPGDDAQPYELRLQILDANDTLTETVRLDMQPATFGLGGRGVRAIGREEHGAFEVEILTDVPTLAARFNFSTCDLSGKTPARVLPGLRAAAGLRAPHRFRIAAAHGPVEFPSIPIPAREHEGELAPSLLIELIDSLAHIQEHTTTQVAIPDLTTFTVAQARHVIRAARLLRGETLTGRWTDIELDIPDSETFAPHVGSEPSSWRLEQPLSLVINGAYLDLGYERTLLRSARVEHRTTPTGPEYALVAGDDNTTETTHSHEPTGSAAPER